MTTAALPRTTPLNAVTSLRGALHRVLAFSRENRLFTAGVVLLLALVPATLMREREAPPSATSVAISAPEFPTPTVSTSRSR